MRLLSVATLTCAFAAQAFAQLVTWDVNGINASSTNPFAGTIGTNISSASLTLGSGVSASSAASTFGGIGFNQTSLSSAISNTQYISFTLSPTANFSYSISSIVLNPEPGSATTGGNFNFALFSSATGFTSGTELWTFSTASASPPAQTITLSGIGGLQGQTSQTEFRIYAWIDSGASGTTTARIRNLSGADLTISGSTSAIPEPSTYAVIISVIALAGAVWRRHKGA